MKIDWKNNPPKSACITAVRNGIGGLDDTQLARLVWHVVNRTPMLCSGLAFLYTDGLGGAALEVLATNIAVPAKRYAFGSQAGIYFERWADCFGTMCKASEDDYSIAIYRLEELDVRQIIMSLSNERFKGKIPKVIEDVVPEFPETPAAAVQTLTPLKKICKDCKCVAVMPADDDVCEQCFGKMVPIK